MLCIYLAVSSESAKISKHGLWIDVYIMQLVFLMDNAYFV